MHTHAHTYTLRGPTLSIPPFTLPLCLHSPPSRLPICFTALLNAHLLICTKVWSRRDRLSHTYDADCVGCVSTYADISHSGIIHQSYLFLTLWNMWTVTLMIVCCCPPFNGYILQFSTSERQKMAVVDRIRLTVCTSTGLIDEKCEVS